MGADQPQDLRVPPAADAGAITVHQPSKLTSIESGSADARGVPTRISCTTCHSLRASGPLPNRPQALETFHRGLTFTHGTLACAACHQEGAHDQLHLADGTVIPLTEVLRLCAQCHGPQFRDYGHGAHGGMNGYWDLRRGQRLRNNCVDCHDPHAPQIPRVNPVLPPRDRFIESAPAPGARRAPHASTGLDVQVREGHVP